MMKETQTDINLGRCPTCGYTGLEEICPFDGTALRPKRGEELAATDRTEALSQAVEIHPEDTASATPVQGSEAPPNLKGEDFGQWAVPEVTEKRTTLIGQEIGGRYTITSLLGQGGMGTVYAAHQASVDRSVAIKVLNREFAENPSIVRRFHQEAMAASRLIHPNTISVYDFGETDGLLYIAMEHLRGETLKSAMDRQGPFPPVRALEILRQILKSVGEAHRHGIVHRDLKPENIFLTKVEGETDFVKVLDFGVAQLRNPDDDQTTLTQVGSIFGTPRYMAPEQSKDVAIDARIDLYSIGVILYEMVLGSAPFDGENPLSVLLAHAHEAVPRFQERRPDLSLPETLEAVTLKALAKDRDRRHLNAEAFVTDIELLLNSLKGEDPSLDTSSLPSLGHIVGTQSIEAVSISMADRPRPIRPPARNLNRNLWIGAMAAIAMVAALWAFGDRGNNDPERDKPAPESTPIAGATPDTPPSSKPITSGQDIGKPTTVQPGTFSVETRPSGATLIDRQTGIKLGTSPAKLELTARTQVVARLKGYRAEEFVIDPAARIYSFQSELKPVPRKPRRRPGRSSKPAISSPRPTPAAGNIVIRKRVVAPTPKKTSQEPEDIEFD